MKNYAREIAAGCLENEEPACKEACPFHLDIREFVTRVRQGRWDAAYRTLETAVGFPAIVALLCDEPCRSACPRREADCAVELKRLEAAVLAYAANKKANKYNLPKKDARVAVIGAGLGGLACALRLANRKYDVTVFEKSGEIGGIIRQHPAYGVFIEDIGRQFANEEYGLLLNRRILNLDELLPDKRFDAVYVATGKGGDDFGLLSPLKKTAAGPPPYPSEAPGVFLGGMLTGASLMEAAAQGLRAAGLIEAYLKTGNMKGLPPRSASRLVVDPGSFVRAKGIREAEGGLYSREEAAAEAARCARCRCDACVRHCDMMRLFRKFPKRVAEEVEATVNPGSIDGEGTMATRLISTCNQCGLCASVCPVGIDVGTMISEARHALHKRGGMPWAFHEFWLRDMAYANGEYASFISIPEPYEKSECMFFPGCQLGASDPRYVSEPYKFLTGIKPDTAIFAHCCGAPAIWAGDAELAEEVKSRIIDAWKGLGEPRAIFACPTCMKVFEDFMPEITGELLFDIMNEWGFVSPAGGKGREVSIFDPCAARERPASRESVRSLARSAGLTLIPLPYEGELAKCCSFGGQIDIAAPNYAKRLAGERAAAGCAPYVTYCSNCRDVFADAGKEAYHILDALFGLNEAPRRAPSASERRKNRRRLCGEMTRMPMPDPGFPLVMDDEVRAKVDSSRLLESDIISVIGECEREGRKFFDAENGHFFGCGEIGHHTLWVEYAPDGGSAYRLFGAYSHRMKLETGG